MSRPKWERKQVEHVALLIKIPKRALAVLCHKIIPRSLPEPL